MELFNKAERFCDLYYENRKKLTSNRWVAPEFMKNEDFQKNEKSRDKALKFMYPNFDTMNEGEKREKWKAHKPSRYVTTYDPVVENGCVNLREVNTPFPVDVKMKTGSKIPKEILDVLPIKPSPVCKWVGQTPFPIGSGPQRYVEGEPTFREFLKESPQYHYLQRGDNLDMISVKGSWQTNSIDVKMAATDTKRELTHDKLMAAFKKRCHRLILPVITIQPQREHIASTPVNPDTYPGLITSKLFGSTKKKAFDGGVEVTRLLWDKISLKVRQDVSLWAIGGRERPQCMVEDGKAVRSRGVWMPEFSSNQISQLYSRPIQAGLQVLQKTRTDMELLCGNSFYHGGWGKWVKRWKNYTNVLFADWSRHDQTVCEETMVVGFSILRACFPESDRIDKHFLFIMSGVIHKHVAIPGRFIYMISKGIPSGSPFTSLLSTVCCWLEWSYIFWMLDIEEEIDLGVYGDDTIAGLPDSVVFPPNMEEKAMQWLGMKLDPFSISLFQDDDHPELAANFLKTASYYGLPGRSVDDIFRILDAPKNRSYGYYDNSYKIVGTLYTGPGNFEASKLVTDFRDWLRRKTFKNKGVDPIRNSVGEKAAWFTYRQSFRNYYTDSIPWVDKELPVLYWLAKESYVEYNRDFESRENKRILSAMRAINSLDTHSVSALH
jgi:hypothetical protein